jgi:hypothetical protein
MRLGSKRLDELKILIKKQTGQILTDEEAQKVGLSIMRFVYLKKILNQEIRNLKEKSDDKSR